eukprot:14928195-Ditylum_brightwellii.AAC.1
MVSGCMLDRMHSMWEMQICFDSLFLTAFAKNHPPRILQTAFFCPFSHVTFQAELIQNHCYKFPVHSCYALQYKASAVPDHNC